MTTLFPIVQIAEGTYEIDIFDTGSVFLLVGDEKALVIDTGIGIGDLKAMIEKLTDKPYTVVMSHGHGDHTGGAGQFGAYHMNEKDFAGFGVTAGMEMRKGYASFFPKKFPDRYYPYDPEKDIVDLGDDITRIPMAEGQAFELGNRAVIAYECPGHTPGSMVFLDEKSRCLFAGDALNCNLLLRSRPGDQNYVKTSDALKGLKRIKAMGDKYDGIYNGHHDFRPLGAPLKANVLDNAIELLESILAGTYTPIEQPTGMFGMGGDSATVKKNETMITFLPGAVE